MFDLRTNAVTALTSYGVENVDAVYDFKNTDKAKSNVRSGKYPVPSAILGVGDWRIVKREPWTYGRNQVTSELDILFFSRKDPTTYEYGFDTELANALTKATLGSDDTILVKVREADPLAEIHENIWSRRWILEVLAVETLT